ncbi:MAG: glycosyltransferase family 4 protein [Ignavibacteria bacterium]|jgi:glycosyltransferase involved in cell wall biosynthesis
MKVLITCLSRSWGGLEMYAITTMNLLLNKNINAEILCVKGSRIFNESVANNFKVHTVDSAGYFNIKAILKTSKILRNGYDIIHSHLSKDLWILVPALKIISSQTVLCLTKHVGSFIVKKDFLHKRLYNRVNKIFAISTVIKKNLVDTCPVNESKVELLLNGIDVRKFDPIKSDKNKIRKEYNIGDELLIGMMARFTPGKGHEEFINAAEVVSKRYPEIKFLIVGEPSKNEEEYTNQIKKMVADKKLNRKIIFTGFRKDTNDVLVSLDIFVFPSHAEAFGLALIEAMAMETATICSNSDGILDIAIDNETSLYFQNKNAEDLACKMEHLIGSPVKRKELAEKGRKRVLEKFTSDIHTSLLINHYNKMLEKSFN